MIKPASLVPGATIGVVAPASPVPAEELARGVSLLESRGYRVVVGKHVLDRARTNNYLAGEDSDRAEDINTMFARDDIDAILCARGGYGSMRLLDRLDWEMIAHHPKIFVGYSDITSLHLALARRPGMVTFHGPMVGSLANLKEASADLFWKLLEVPAPIGELPAEPAGIRTIVAGTAEGELAGGCLCLLARALGSDHAPDFNGKIVVIEDVGEAIYRIDRDLTQLRNAGLLKAAAGFVIGTITRWQAQEADPPENTPDTLWQEFFTPLGIPTITGFPFGHEPNPLSLPLGVRARLDADVRTLTLLESATR